MFPKKITVPKLVLAEGKDMLFFLIWACRTYRQEEDFEVMDYGGINELSNFLRVLPQIEGYDTVSTLIVARDAECNSDSAFASIQNAMTRAGMPTVIAPFEYTEEAGLRAAVLIFPGPGCEAGTLEDLCLSTVESDPIMLCVEQFVECVSVENGVLPRVHKNKLHCFLSGKDKYVGSKVGQASYMGAWDPTHKRLDPFKRIIAEM